ncbi:hypothetical protein [Jannaschia sp. M317]|uniref:hypothetical protein n=1 Tax=Jannaschia sp. M317 TaxID=2867011 RepID=UPI0021A26DCD|nr:hypothetical protein [Jannaschia sp. M317]UWQ17259.1 hypothetical protein K3551_15425 [Jannaschia sp. M317]
MADLFIDPLPLSRHLHDRTAPLILDLRDTQDAVADPRLIPGARPATLTEVATMALPDGPVICSCQKGGKLSQLAAGLLQDRGRDARPLRGGHLAWVAQDLPLCAATPWPKQWVMPLDPDWGTLCAAWVLLRLVNRQATLVPVERAWISQAAAIWPAHLVPADPQALADRAGLRHPVLARLSGGPERLLRGRLSRVGRPVLALDLVDDWLAVPEVAA